MTLSNVRQWDVWLCYLHFLDHPETGKVRPVVIIEIDGSSFVVAKVTTADNSAFPSIAITDWKEAGLLKPSRAQLDPLFAIHGDELLRENPIGALSNRDRIALHTSLTWTE